MQFVFARAIRLARVTKGFTQAQLADKIGINAAHMSRIENNTTGVSERMLLLVAKALELEPWEVVAYAKHSR
jgi:transcriptional regulator with XRE-family HTH domain